MIDLKQIDKSWTLFLDRDGVINNERHMNYINTWDDFKFFPGVKEAIKKFTESFGNIFIVTNQRGVAKGVTKIEELEIINKNLLEEVAKSGGKITKIYFCCDMDNASQNRKPNPGMGLQAKQEFPEVDFSKSVMIGNTITDMEFGRNLGVAMNIFLPSTHPHIGVQHPTVDRVFPDLFSVAKAL
ncbi:MAG TPA: HAD-IIIA family hydrolase [Chitinophagaceae bacterium]|nr:HAD-IIIA family hydrolase [Chitinophagaceae bacterium]